MKGENSVEKIKSNINLLIAISIMFFSVLNTIIWRLDYIYRPKSYILFFVVYLIFSSILTYFSVHYKNYASRISRRIASFMPLISLLYLITLLFCFDFKIDNRMDNIFYYELLLVISLSSSLFFFFVYNRVKWLKICIAVVVAIFAKFFLGVLFLSMLLSNFGENTVVHTAKSPDNTYIAWVVSSDQGALGGSTDVYVRNIQKDIYLASGMLKTEWRNLWSGRWGTEVTLNWKDDDTLMIDGKSYNVE